ncbi:hypothetical protein C8A01DRAFT_43128 [Parachaetomium inaequale]|uniref:gamma-glutamylcyclotransferase n=1 Tax=Parachaetomium inaequale TaxID=2588326 RepID=A0AAN6PNE3_9PEZI|nr:hypothetical protein C8A01DRAFT_43128 [Parachaetomium inaequale]
MSRPTRQQPAPPAPTGGGGGGGQLYFAYGSNLSLSQMAARCPDSYLVGRAVLSDYRWQINERGFANLTPCAGYAVHGLVFELDGSSGGGSEDERRLDRSEGVHSGAYAKVHLPVVLYPAAAAMQLRTRGIVEAGGPGAVLASVRSSSSRRGSVMLEEQPPRVERDVLVYLSDVFVRPGDPRDEYVDRINRGIVDAVALGVPAEFFENVVRGYVPDRPVPAVTAPSPAAAWVRQQSDSRRQSNSWRASLNESAWIQSQQSRRSGGGRERASSVSPEPRAVIFPS